VEDDPVVGDPPQHRRDRHCGEAGHGGEDGPSRAVAQPGDQPDEQGAGHHQGPALVAGESGHRSGDAGEDRELSGAEPALLGRPVGQAGERAGDAGDENRLGERCGVQVQHRRVQHDDGDHDQAGGQPQAPACGRPVAAGGGGRQAARTQQGCAPPGLPRPQQHDEGRQQEVRHRQPDRAELGEARLAEGVEQPSRDREVAQGVAVRHAQPGRDEPRRGEQGGDSGERGDGQGAGDPASDDRGVELVPQAGGAQRPRCRGGTGRGLDDDGQGVPACRGSGDTRGGERRGASVYCLWAPEARGLA